MTILRHEAGVLNGVRPLRTMELDASPNHGVERIFGVACLLVLLFQALFELFLSLGLPPRRQETLPDSVEKRPGNNAPGPLPTRAA